MALSQRPGNPKGRIANQPLMMDFPGELPISVYQCASVVECLFLLHIMLAILYHRAHGGHAVVE